VLIGCKSSSLEERGFPATRATTRPAATQAAVTGAVPLFPDASPAVVTSVTRKIFPSVVRLDVAQEIYSEGKRNLRRGIGSGVIIDDDGRILTNYHVAGRAAEILVTLANKERVPAKLIGDAHSADLTIVPRNTETIRKKNIPF